MQRFVFSCAIVLLAAACPRSLPGQFQEPNKEELQMTADPKAPGAAAVYLYREDLTDQIGRSRTFYERIKILTDSGKELATVQVPYEPGMDRVEIVGRTIHSDGTIIPLTDKPSDLVDLKTEGYQRNTMVFTLPGAEIGSILEYQVTVHTTDFPGHPTWMIQQPYFVHKAHYVYRAPGPSRDSYVARIKPGVKVEADKNGNYTLDIADVPALPDDDWMPPLNTLEWRVSFFFANFSTTEVFWSKAEKSWGEFVHEFTKPTGLLKSAAEGMSAKGDSETQKAKKIYAAVMKLENTDFTRHKSEAERKMEKIKDIRSAQDVWKEQGGNADEIALLFVALCRAAGLRVESMKVVDRSQALFDPALLTARQLDDYIAVGQLDGKEVYLDPGEKMCPFGMLRWRHMLTSGFRSDGKSASISRTPSFGMDGPSVERIADLTIDETGKVEGTVRVVLGGQDALHWRQITIENDEDEVKKRFNEWLGGDLPEGVQAEFDHFLGLEDYESNLIGIAHVSGSLGTVTGRRLFLPGLFFESKGRHPFVAQEKRTVPVDVEYPKSVSDDVTYRLPPGFTVESGPQASSFAWPDRASFSISISSQESGVNVARALGHTFTILDAKEYGNLRDFYQKVAAADQQQVVLIRAPAKGN